ncbi:conjugal transfer protein TraB [Streptomyces eurythermus]
MSNLARRPSLGAAVPTDGSNRYKAVQAKLKKLSKALDSATGELAALQRRMRLNADQAEKVSTQISHAQLDRKFVYMTYQVSIALGGAAFEVGRLVTTAKEVSRDVDAARSRHARLYAELDEVRSNRAERTPKPGFFAH